MKEFELIGALLIALVSTFDVAAYFIARWRLLQNFVPRKLRRIVEHI